jgi:hypothetical protein
MRKLLISLITRVIPSLLLLAAVVGLVFWSPLWLPIIQLTICMSTFLGMLILTFLPELIIMARNQKYSPHMARDVWSLLTEPRVVMDYETCTGAWTLIQVPEIQPIP